jgi:hypothetical protein
MWMPFAARQRATSGRHAGRASRAWMKRSRRSARLLIARQAPFRGPCAAHQSDRAARVPTVLLDELIARGTGNQPPQRLKRHLGAVGVGPIRVRSQQLDQRHVGEPPGSGLHSVDPPSRSSKLSSPIDWRRPASLSCNAVNQQVRLAVNRSDHTIEAAYLAVERGVTMSGPAFGDSIGAALPSVTC